MYFFLNKITTTMIYLNNGKVGIIRKPTNNRVDYSEFEEMAKTVAPSSKQSYLIIKYTCSSKGLVAEAGVGRGFGGFAFTIE